ncbi:MAG: UDP-N-acetylglucosamine 2-epimerase, partial [Nitrospira bacterium SG8_35_4]
MKKKVCIVTGTRAEYGLFYPLLKRLKSANEFEIRIIATGMHLSPEFGHTYKEIEGDGFPVDEKVEMLLSSDTETGISKSIGIGIISFAEVFGRSKPDLLIVLGDRFETFAAAVAAFIARIPVAHLHGGEVTDGVIDDSLRHSITKMAYLHFTSAEKYRQRVIQLGESPDRVFNVGA